VNGETAIEGSGVNLRAHRFVAGGVFFSALLLYLSTVAPTTSFWDCGEFIASAYSLGVPHPPGAPFFLLLGRLFTMFLPLPDIGLRVNVLSVLVSALTILLTYLIIVRLIRRWRGPEHTTTDKWVMYGSGAVGALAFAVSHSFWFNAVEAEVYAISMFFTALVVWFAVRWMDYADKKSSTKYLLLIAYFVGLSTGVHLLNVLALSPIILLIYFQKYPFSWKGLVVAVGISFLGILAVYPGIVSGVPNLIDESFLVQAGVLFLGLAALVLAIRARRHLLALVLASLFLVLLGYSTYITIYIRSNQDPVINENQPDTVERLIYYLNREQYGAVGPVELQSIGSSVDARLRQGGAKFLRVSPKKILRFHILERKAPFWSYQINKMYIRYLRWQYFIGELGQPLLLPFLFGILGMVWHFWRDPKRGSVIMLLFLMTGIAIVFYLNQEDPQPRERDYAYVGSYFAFALWIGIGVAALFETVEDMLRNKGAGARRAVAVGTVVLAAAGIPLNMVLQNYRSHDRSGNYVAWDYSHNLLETCAPNAMLFTNGDNDTFPLWYLQVVEGVRTDVRVINLSLLNTNWYIKQLRDEEPKIAIRLTDREIDEKLTARTDEALLLRYWPGGGNDWSIHGPEGDKITWEVPPTIYIATGLPNEERGKPNFLRVQDVMILHILEQNRWKRPVYFAVTVSQTNLLGLQPYLSMEGLAFRLHPEKVPDVDVEKIRENLFETYAGHYRNLDNPKVFFFPYIVKLVQNYRSAFLQLVYEYYRQTRRPGLPESSNIPREQWKERFDELTPREKALYALELMETVMPQEVIPMTNRDAVLQLGRLKAELGDREGAGREFERMATGRGVTNEDRIQAAYYMLQYTDKRDEAAGLLDEVLAGDPTVRDLFNVAAVYERAKMKDRLAAVLERISMIPNLSTRQQLDLASFYLTSDMPAKAKPIYEMLSQQDPSNGEALGGLLEVYRAEKDTQNLVRLLDTWLERNPDDRRAAEMLQAWKSPKTP